MRIYLLNVFNSGIAVYYFYSKTPGIVYDKELDTLSSINITIPLIEKETEKTYMKYFSMIFCLRFLREKEIWWFF